MRRTFEYLPGRLWFINIQLDTTFFGVGLSFDYDARDDFMLQIGLGVVTVNIGRDFLAAQTA